MSNQGIKSGELIGNTFKGIASAAYMMNTDIDSASGLFSKMITSGALMNRSLAQAGITMEDFAKVMGINASEVSKKFKEMSADQRASIMEMVLNNKYGSDANEGFKNSWEGLQLQLDKAIGGLTRFAGELLLPVFIPATQVATDVINFLTDSLRGLPEPLKMVLGGAGAAAGGIAVFSLGASALGKVIPSLTGGLGTIKNFFSAIKSGSGILSALTKGGGLVAHTAELGANTTALTANTAALEANNLARATSAGTDAAKAIGGGKTLSSGVTQLGSVGAAAGSAAPGAAAGATGFTAISASISSMLVPLLSISAVIAIMIPIVAGLAIEILAFVRLVGEVVKVLRFDKLDLGSSIEGIKQIGLAMWELGRAFAALTIVNMVGIVYTATGGILTTSLALAQFMVATKEIEAVLKQVTDLKIDQSAVNKITQIKNVLSGISVAMSSMSNLNLAGLGVMLTGGMQAIRQNIRHLTDIGKEIQAMSIPTVSNDKIEMIKKLSESLQHIQKASNSVNESLGWFGEKMTTITDTNGVRTTLDNLYKIAIKINEVNLPNISTEKAETIKSLSSAIGDIQKASDSINESLGWFGEKMTTITDTQGLKTTLDNLYIIATQINTVNLPNIGKDKLDAIRNIKNAIIPLVDSSKAISDNYGSIIATPGMAEPFKTAITSLYGINQRLNETAFNLDSSKTEAITNLKTIIQRVAEIGLYLSQNSNNIGKNISDNATNIKSSITSLYGINQKINESAFNLSGDKVTALNNIKNFISAVKNIGQVITDNLTAISSISTNAASVKGAISALYGINQQINSMPFQVDEAKTTAINSLKTLIQTIVSTLSAASGVQPAAQNMGSKITTGFKTGAQNLTPAVITVLSSAINAVQARYATMRSAGNALGAALASGFKSGAGINSPMAVVVSGLSDTLAHINSLSSKFYSAGEALGSAVQDSYRAQHKSTTVAGYSKLINEVRSDVVNLFNSSGISWMGGSASAAGGGAISAAGGDIADYKIEYPSNNEYHYHLETTFLSQNDIDRFDELKNKHKQQDAMRTG